MKKSKSPNFVTTKPFGNYFRKYKTQFVWPNIFQNNLFFFLQFSPSRGLQTTLASWTETETNTMTSLILNNCMIPPFYLNVVTISKYFNLIFLYFNFQNYPVNPVNQYYLDHQFCHFSTAKILSWCMAAIRKMVFKRKSNAFPINLWNKILRQLKLRGFTAENIYGTRMIYDLWTCSCIDEYKRELTQHLKLWRKFAPFPPV